MALPPLAGQTTPRIIPETSERRGIVTLGKTNENNFATTYLNNEYHDDQENQIPALQSIPKPHSTHNKDKIDLTKEESIESSTSSTSHYLHDIEKSHESELCQLHNDDNQQICLLESNSAHKLCDVYETSFMSPSRIRFLQWNWWNIDTQLIKYYKNDVTFHGPNLYLSGPISTSPYPLLRPSNFDTIDFEYPLKHIACRLPDNDHNISLMTQIVSESIQQDIHNHVGSERNSNGMNRFTQRRYSNAMTSDEELEKDIHQLNIKWSVSGTFIAKPYNEDVYHADGSFDIHLHCNWNIDCIESDCQYNVYILPSHPRNRNQCKEIQVYENDYHSLDAHDKINGTLRIYPQENNENKARNTRKRSRSQMDDEYVANNHNHNTSDGDHTKRRRLNDGRVPLANGMQHDEKEELEHKTSEYSENKPLQKRFKHKSSNRKSPRSAFINKTEQRYGNKVAVTVDKKPKGSKRHQSNKQHKTKPKMDPNARYRGYFIAIFLPRSPELYPFCTESMNLQPFIRGQIVFYDAIHADQAKPNRENYQWLIGNIIKTYRKKGRNLEEFVRMKREVDFYQKQIEYHEQNGNHHVNHHMHSNNISRSVTGSLVFDDPDVITKEERVVEEGQVIDLASSSVEPQPPDSH